MSLAKPHRRLDLTRPSAVPASGDAEQPGVTESRRAIAALEARCARLEALLARQAEQGPPFRVTDGAGRTLLDVDADSTGATLQLLDPTGEPAALLSVEAAGGALTLLNGSGCVTGAVVLHPSGGRIVIRDAGGNPAVIVEAAPGGGGLEVRMLGEEAAAAASPRVVPVVDTGGGLSPRSSAAAPALSDFTHAGRKAVALYSEGLRGAMRIYDQAGACVYSRD